MSAQKQQRPERRLVSLRYAADVLGVSRGRTLAPMIESGKIRTVEVNGRKRIPLTEIERLCRDGFDARQG